MNEIDLDIKIVSLNLFIVSGEILFNISRISLDIFSSSYITDLKKVLQILTS